MLRLLVVWLISTLALLAAARIVPGFRIRDFSTALLAAAVMGLVNATIGAVVHFLAFPFKILTLGLAHLLVNALLLMLGAKLVPGFRIDGCLPAILGALVVAVVNMLLIRLVF